MHAAESFFRDLPIVAMQGSPRGVRVDRSDTDKRGGVMTQRRIVPALLAAGVITMLNGGPAWAQVDTTAQIERAQTRDHERDDRDHRRIDRRERRDDHRVERRHERPARPDRPERPERVARPDRPERRERPERPERREQPERPIRSGRI